MSGPSKEANEENETNSSCRSDILAMFNACGYHRVRVHSLNDYDRIVGGIAWAITRFYSISVAVDLLYDETDDKLIKVRTEQSEKIIEALEGIECPHKISAHQLLGLDFPALRNVVQWLLMRILALVDSDEAHQRFDDWFKHDYENKEEEALGEFRRRLRNTYNNQQSVVRHMKRFGNSILFNLSLDAQCTLAEYINYARTGESVVTDEEEKLQEHSSNLEESSAKKNVPSGAVRAMMEKAVVDMDAVSKHSNYPRIVSMSVDLLEIPERLSNIEDRIVDEAASILEILKTKKEIVEIYNAVVRDTADMSDNDVHQLSEVIRHYQVASRRAEEIKRLSTQDYNEASREEIRRRRNMDDFGNVKKYCVKSRELADRYGAIAKKFVTSTRKTLALQFRLERNLGGAFNNQYRKRDLERLMDSVRMTDETRMTMFDYNLIIDILDFMTRINGFMNQLESNLQCQPAAQEYRDAFVSYMNDVRNQLSEFHHKAKMVQSKLLDEKSELATIRNTIRLQERDISYKTQEMKRLLDFSLALNEVDDELTKVELSSPSFTIHASRQLTLDREFEQQERAELAKRAERAARREEDMAKYENAYSKR